MTSHLGPPARAFRALGARRGRSGADKVQPKHLGDVSLGLGIRRDSSVAINRSFARVVCCEQFWQLEGASVDAMALPQILDKSRRSEYIFDGIEWVSHSEAERCFRHQLHEPQRSGSRSCSRITSGLDLGYRSQEVGVQPVHIADGDAERSFVILSRPCNSVSTECGADLDDRGERGVKQRSIYHSLRHDYHQGLGAVKRSLQ